MNAGSTGFTGETGGVYLEFDAVTSANLPTGRHFYDLELIEGTEVTRLVQGRFKTNEENHKMNKLEIEAPVSLKYLDSTLKIN